MAKKKLPAEVLEYFREEGAKGGKLGGPARAAKLTPERRSAIAKSAVAAREAKRTAASKTAKTATTKKSKKSK
jgi:hypothetical protein